MAVMGFTWCAILEGPGISLCVHTSLVKSVRMKPLAEHQPESLRIFSWGVTLWPRKQAQDLPLPIAAASLLTPAFLAVAAQHLGEAGAWSN